MTVVVDASVVLKWFLPEIGSDQARLLLAGDGLLVAPAHAAAEVGHVLSQHVRAGKLRRDEANEALRALPRILVAIQLASISEEALSVAAETGTSYYDALYVAAAERWDTTLVTADHRLVRNVAGSRWARRVRALGTISEEQRP